jgi:hypothetical protein
VEIVENVPINCKIEFGLKVGFAINQVQLLLLLAPYVTKTHTGKPENKKGQKTWPEAIVKRPSNQKRGPGRRA